VLDPDGTFADSRQAHVLARVTEMRWLRLLPIALALLIAPAVAQPVEKPDVTVAIGSWIVQYLPLPVASAQGYFKDEGLNATVQNFDAGGSKALQALLGGSVDAVVGFYDHTIHMQMQGKAIRCVIQLNQIPGIVIAVRKDLAGEISNIGQLKGRRIGITALGSASDFQVHYLAARAGLSATDYSVVAVGSDATAIAAMEHRSIDAIDANDPAVTVMQRRGLIEILVDARTVDGANQAFGGKYPAACLYATEDFINRNPITIQHLVNAFARALTFINRSTPEQITAVLPPAFIVGDRDTTTLVLSHAKAIFPAVGRFDPDGLKRAEDVVAGFDPRVKSANIDLEKTYTNRFVDAAPQP
jgi:NitT/TauT family transport system substrate-binding protein